MKKKKRIKLSDSIVGVLGALMGFFIGLLGARSGAEDRGVIGVIIVVLMIIVSMYGQTIIHEAGHLLFGLLTGYKFVSFRIGSFILIKEDKFKIKRYAIKGTAGQCLMDPPNYEKEKFPYVLYNLGGGLLNLIISFIVILVMILTNPGPNIRDALYIFSAFGIFIGLTNLIPLNMGGISNDGLNIISIKKSEEARYSFYLQLKVNALLMTGTRYKDMPIDLINAPEELDIKNSINLSRKLLEGNYYLDVHDFKKVKELFEKILEDEDILELYKKEVICDLLFCELVTELNEDKIKELYSDNIKKYIKQNKFMVSKRRIEYAYELLVNKDREKAKKSLEEFNKILKVSPYKGEVLSELELISIIDKKLEEILI